MYEIRLAKYTFKLHNIKITVTTAATNKLLFMTVATNIPKYLQCIYTTNFAIVKKYMINTVGSKK